MNNATHKRQRALLRLLQHIKQRNKLYKGERLFFKNNPHVSGIVLGEPSNAPEIQLTSCAV